MRARWIGAAVLVLWASCVQAQVGDTEGRRPADQQQRPAELAPLPIEIVEDEAEAEARRNAQQRAEHREIEDLAAQQGLNEATRHMADLAGWQTFLVLCGTIALIVTLYFTREANVAAREAGKVTRDIGERQIRAYVNIANIQIENFRECQPVVIKYNINTCGQTPAYIIKVRVTQRVTADPEREGIRFNVMRRGSVGMIGAATKLRQELKDYIPVGDENYQSTLRGGKHLILCGYIIYKDVFRKTKRTVVRVQLNLERLEDGTAPFTICARNNRMS